MKKNKVKFSFNKELIKPKKVDIKLINNSTDEELAKSINIANTHSEEVKELREKRLMKNDVANIQKKQKNHERYMKFRPILIAIFVILIVLAIFLFFNYGPLLGLNMVKKMDISEAKKIEFITTDNDIYLNYCNELLVYANQSLNTYDASGKKTWEYKFSDIFTPDIYVQGKYMAVSNNSTGVIRLFENKTEILNKKIDGNIENIFLDNNGNMAVEYSTSGFKKIIGVYSKEGNERYNAYLEAGSIIDIKLLDGGSKLLVAQANSTSFKIGVDFILVNGRSKEENIKKIAKLDNNLLYDLTIQGQNIIILLDNKIIRLDMNTGAVTDLKDFDSNQLLYVTLSDNYYIYVEKELNSQKDSYTITTARFDNSIIGTYEIENSPKTLKTSGILNYFIYQDNLHVINKWAVEVKEVSIDFPPKDVVIFDNEKSAGLIYTNKIYIVNI